MGYQFNHFFSLLFYYSFPYLHFFVRGTFVYYRPYTPLRAHILSASNLDCDSVVARLYGEPKPRRPNKDSCVPRGHNKNGILGNRHSARLPAD